MNYEKVLKNAPNETSFWFGEFQRRFERLILGLLLHSNVTNRTILVCAVWDKNGP